MWEVCPGAGCNIKEGGQGSSKDLQNVRKLAKLECG